MSHPACFRGSWQSPSPSKGHKDTAAGARGRGNVRVARCLRCVCFGVGKANEINQERNRVQVAASMAGDGLQCFASLESQHESRDRGKSAAQTTQSTLPGRSLSKSQQWRLQGKLKRKSCRLKSKNEAQECTWKCPWVQSWSRAYKIFPEFRGRGCSSHPH